MSELVVVYDMTKDIRLDATVQLIGDILQTRYDETLKARYKKTLKIEKNYSNNLGTTFLGQYKEDVRVGQTY